MLAYMDFFLGGDEKRSDHPPRLHQRLPVSLLFGGDGSYMAPFSLQSDNITTSLMSQAVPPTTWFRFVTGLNAQLLLVRCGCLRLTFRPVLKWMQTFANPALKIYGIRIDLAWFQAATGGFCQYGLLLNADDEDTDHLSFQGLDGALWTEPQLRGSTIYGENPSSLTEDSFLGRTCKSGENNLRRKIYGGILDVNCLKKVEEKRDVLFALLPGSCRFGHLNAAPRRFWLSFVLLLTMLQLYSVSLADVFLFLFILPLGILLPFPAGINALFTHGPRHSAGLARVYALQNLTSLINVVVAFICGFVHYSTQSRRKLPYFQP